MSGFTAELYKQLRRDEGEVLHVYQDHLGFWTLGVGRLVDARKGGGITQEESAYLLDNDIQSKLDDLDRHLPWYRTLDPTRQGVLVNMCFQLGITGLLDFKNTLQAVYERRWEDAAKGMLASKWAHQTPERAWRLAEQMRTGEWK